MLGLGSRHSARVSLSATKTSCDKKYGFDEITEDNGKYLPSGSTRWFKNFVYNKLLKAL